MLQRHRKQYKNIMGCGSESSYKSSSLDHWESYGLKQTRNSRMRCTQKREPLKSLGRNVETDLRKVMTLLQWIIFWCRFSNVQRPGYLTCILLFVLAVSITWHPVIAWRINQLYIRRSFRSTDSIRSYIFLVSFCHSCKDKRSKPWYK